MSPAAGRSIATFALIAVSLTLLIACQRAVADDAGTAPSTEAQHLIAQLQSDDVFVRLKAARSLGNMGAAAESALPALRKLSNDPDEDVRAVARTAIQKIGAGAADGLQPLIQQLSDKDPMVRLKAAKALGEKGQAAQSAAESLRKLLEDADEDVRLVAGSALKKIDVAPGDATGPAVVKAKPAEPKPADVEVRDTLSLFSAGRSDAAGLRTWPSRRFFLVALRNNTSVPLRVSGMKLSWQARGGGDSGDAESVPVGGDLLLPGADGSLCVAVESTEANRKCRLSVEQVQSDALAEDEVAELQAQEALRRHLSVPIARPLRDTGLGLHLGDLFIVRNSGPATAKGVRLVLLGYNPEGELVRIMVYYLHRVAEGDTTVDTGPGDFHKMERARKLADLEDLADVARDVEVVRYEARIAGVGVTRKQK